MDKFVLLDAGAEYLPIINFNFEEIIITLINTFLIFFILRFFLFKRVKAVLDKRNQIEKERLAKAEQAQARAEKLCDDYIAKIDNVKTEARQLYAEAIHKVNVRGEAIIEKANEEAREIQLKAKENIEKEKQKAVADVKKQISELVVITAQNVIERELKEEDNERIIDELIVRATELEKE